MNGQEAKSQHYQQDKEKRAGNLQLFGAEIDRKSLADMFRTFASKDTECKIVINDDGTAKVKLIAGSLSKSYPFELDDAAKSILANDGWLGFAESKF